MWMNFFVDLGNVAIFWKGGLQSRFSVLLYRQQFRDTFTVNAVGRKSGSDETLCRIRIAVSLLLRAC